MKACAHKQVVAQCKTPSQLYLLPDEFAIATDGTTNPPTFANLGCARRLTKAQLISLIDASTAVAAGTAAASNITTDVKPEPDASGAYDLLASSHGNSYTFTLTKSSANGSSSCEAVVTVVAKQPSASCRPTATLPAGSDCAAHISSAALQTLVLAPGFTPDVGFGGTVSLDVTPAPDGLWRRCLHVHPRAPLQVC